MNPITKSWFQIICWPTILTPFARVRRVVTHELTCIEFHYHDYYVFGIRVARIHV